MDNFKLKICADRECNVKFRQFNSLNKYCSPICKNKNTVVKSKKKYTIPKVSEKRKIENLKYTAQRIIFLGKKENQICPITGNLTTDIHHKKGRVGSLFLDENYWVALSREGHKFVEENPQWAKENGYSLDRLNNN